MEEAMTKSASAKGQVSVGKAKISAAVIYINFSYNNTMLTAADKKGNALGWISAGSLGFSGPKKATPFAASKMVATIAEKLKKIGIVDVDVILKGVGSARDASLKSIAGQGFNILSIKDVTPIPHNGPRPVKARRV